MGSWRIWDLCSNRVVPWWVPLQQPWGISHAWMNEEDREDIMTLINGCQWPVPISKDTNLDLIRIEMLNLGAEYVWLDVLCLRQKGGIREDLHEEEWKVDVPTIGSVYCWAKKVFKRAWTLQEISWDPIIGGDTGDEELWVKFQAQLLSLQDIRGGRLYSVLSEMQKRVSTHPVDKIAGMAYILYSGSIPAYYGKQSEEEAWTAMVDVTVGWSQGDLLFLHPTKSGGNGTKSW
ncbi:hypothetical protein ARMSODRAFT_1022752 [Armillaria solidipes]|uniref:Uncharacterized protein n=1 Tax=Armillaria solidipes TaxID=1076256 RepID=A0A2H3BNY0_9AGAR|nr:hypothetical protein ARMSODRAFT_1022752 [Armillaria solidipes]